jgi:hypothetical protein
MPKNRNFIGLLALISIIFAGLLAAASADSFNRSDKPSGVLVVYDRSSGANDHTQEFAAQSRPRVTIHPRRTYPGPNAKRYCHSWLAKEYRVSGPVIVPQMRCWWE